jgi:rare lipoprotein A
MNVGRNRPGRKDQSRWHAAFAALVLAAVTIAASGAPAQAVTGGVTGGASTAASSSAQVGQGVAFSPMRSAGATWYGPGFYGSHTACGQVLRPGTIGVAHRTLPCGTAVKLFYRGRFVVARVIDRGPYTPGNAFDLTNGTRQALRFEGSARIRYAVALR